MYAVSDKYKEAMKQPVQTHRIRGTIQTMPFQDKNILAGSFSITNQCCSNEGMELGQVFIGELNATFLQVDLPRYQWKGAKIIPEFGLQLSDGTFEYIPLGEFVIESAEWTKSGVVVRAFDNMKKLDKNCNIILTDVTPYQCIKKIEKETGVVFGHEEVDFESFVNGTKVFSKSTTNDIETWRDFVSWLAQTIGCFVTADRFGKIIFRSFSTESVDTISDTERLTGSSFSDFETRYTGLSVVDVNNHQTKYYGLKTDDGLTLNLGSNPFLQYGLQETKDELCTNLLNEIQKIRYVPFKVSMLGNAAYDLGDVLVFTDGLADASKKYCITKFVFQYRGKYEISGVGKDPSILSARTKTDKNLIGLASNLDENILVHNFFANSTEVEIKDTQTEIIANIRFVSGGKQSEVLFYLELMPNLKQVALTEPVLEETVSSDSSPVEEENVGSELEIKIKELDSQLQKLQQQYTELQTQINKPQNTIITLNYMLNGEMIPYHPSNTYFHDGKYVLNLHYYLGNVPANTVFQLVISMNVLNGNLFFEKDSIHVLVSGMSLAGTQAWDGTLQVEEKFKAIDITNTLKNIQEEVEFKNLSPVKNSGVIDTFRLSVGDLIGDIKDQLTSSTFKIIYFIVSSTEGNPKFNPNYVTTKDNVFQINQSYELYGQSLEVDDGILECISPFEALPELESIEGYEYYERY